MRHVTYAAKSRKVKDSRIIPSDHLMRNRERVFGYQVLIECIAEDNIGLILFAYKIIACNHHSAIWESREMNESGPSEIKSDPILITPRSRHTRVEREEKVKDHRRGRTSLAESFHAGVSLVGGTNVARPTSPLTQA